MPLACFLMIMGGANLELLAGQWGQWAGKWKSNGNPGIFCINHDFQASAASGWRFCLLTGHLSAKCFPIFLTWKLLPPVFHVVPMLGFHMI